WRRLDPASRLKNTGGQGTVTGENNWRLTQPPLHPTVPPLAAPVFFDRGEKIPLREVGPEFGRNVHFGVGSLPEQEIRQSHFARSANEQVRIGIISSVKMFAKHRDVDHSFVDVAQFDGAEQTLDAVNDLIAPTVAERQDERQPGIFAGRLNR